MGSHFSFVDYFFDHKLNHYNEFNQFQLKFSLCEPLTLKEIRQMTEFKVKKESPKLVELLENLSFSEFKSNSTEGFNNEAILIAETIDFIYESKIKMMDLPSYNSAFAFKPDFFNNFIKDNIKNRKYTVEGSENAIFIVFKLQFSENAIETINFQLKKREMTEIEYLQRKVNYLSNLLKQNSLNIRIGHVVRWLGPEGERIFPHITNNEAIEIASKLGLGDVKDAKELVRSDRTAKGYSMWITRIVSILLESLSRLGRDVIKINFIHYGTTGNVNPPTDYFLDISLTYINKTNNSSVFKVFTPDEPNLLEIEKINAGLLFCGHVLGDNSHKFIYVYKLS